MKIVILEDMKGFTKMVEVPRFLAVYDLAVLDQITVKLFDHTKTYPSPSTEVIRFYPQGDRPGMGYETIVAMHVPGKSTWNGGGRHGVFIVNKNDSGGHKAPHPTTKPRELIKTLVSLFSNEEDLILDPFGGSCTTALAAKMLKRNYICIEKEQKFINVCHERLDAVTNLLF